MQFKKVLFVALILTSVFAITANITSPINDQTFSTGRISVMVQATPESGATIGCGASSLSGSVSGTLANLMKGICAQNAPCACSAEITVAEETLTASVYDSGGAAALTPGVSINVTSNPLVELATPVSGDVKAGFVGIAAKLSSLPTGCRVYKVITNIIDSTGKTVALTPLSYRAVGVEGTVQANIGTGIWSGYWDSSAAPTGQYMIQIAAYQTGTGCAQTEPVLDQSAITVEAPSVGTGIGGSLSRTGNIVMSVIIAVFGVDLGQIVDPTMATTMVDEFGGLSFPLLIFGFVLPFILSYAILYDMFFLVGFFRPSTARIIALIIALLFSRMNGFGALYAILFNVFANFWISMLSLLFTMMVLYWVLGHLIWGYKFASEINRQENAMDYLHKIGDHLERLGTKEGGKGGK